MHFLISNEITITDPTADMLNYISSLEVDNPALTQAERMGFWTGNIPKKIRMCRRDGDSYIIPFGCIDDIFTDITNNKYDLDFAENRLNTMQGKIDLYDYQEIAVSKLQKARNGLLISPAGSGKTQMALELVHRLKKKTLFLTHTKDLLSQAKSRAEQYFKGDFGIITDGKINIGNDITFATVQTLSKQDLNKFKYTWDCVIVDEVHRVASNSNATAQFEKVLNALACRYKYGITATFHRADGLQVCIPWLIGNIVHEVPREAVADKIMTVQIKRVDTGTQESKQYLNSDGMMNYTKLIEYLCTDEHRTAQIARILNDNAQHSNLILSDRIEHLEALQQAVIRQDLCCMVTGKMTSKQGKADREQAIEDMRTGKKKYLFATFSLAKEGLDIPCLDRLYLTVPKKDKAVVEQSLGRIARTSTDKDIPICYDFVDNIPYCIGLKKKRNTIYKKLRYKFEK